MNYDEASVVSHSYNYQGIISVRQAKLNNGMPMKVMRRNDAEYG
jgi:hypothetical protein